MFGLGVLADHILVCQSLSHHHFPALVVPPEKEDYFLCLLAMTLLSAMVWVLSLSLSLLILHGMHLVVSAHPCFLWVACHPSRTFPPKEPEHEPQNRFSPSPTARPCPLTSDSWLHHLLYWLGMGWWCLDLAYASFPCTSKICLLLTCSLWFGGLSTHFAAHPWFLMAWAIFWLLIL